MAAISACFTKEVERYSQTKHRYLPRLNFIKLPLNKNQYCAKSGKFSFKRALQYYCSQYEKHTNMTRKL